MTNFDPDNPDQEMIHQCVKYARRHLNPIIDWTTDEVWEFLHKYNVPYCCLYDQGFKRLGCIGCPMGTSKNREEWFRRWPTYKQAYIHAFDRMIEVRNEGGIGKTCKQEWKSSSDTSTEIYELERKSMDGVVSERLDVIEKRNFAHTSWVSSEEVMEWWIR